MPVTDSKLEPTPRSATERKLFLSEAAIRRLGGPTGAEIMRLLVEERLAPREVQEKLSLSTGEFDTYVLTHAFQREFKAQKRAQEINAEKHQYGKLMAQPKKSALEATKALPPVKVPAGVSPQEWAVKRLNQVTPEAVERLVHLMRTARQETVQYNAATKLLGLNGIVEVEKSISVIA